MDSRIINILLVEDNPADIDLIREAIGDWKILVNLNVVENGVEALDYLYQQKNYFKATRPDLIFLDLNLPKIDGRQILKQIKNDLYLKTIPVIVLTTSDTEIDILKSYDLGANNFITKPVDFDEFMKAIQSIGDFWFSIVKLPSDKLLHHKNDPFISSQSIRPISPKLNLIRILLIEDNMSDAEYFKEIITEERNLFEIEWRETLSSGLEYLQQGKTDVIITDLGLPDSFGLETFTKLYDHFSFLPIIIYSGLTDLDLALNAVRSGAQDYLVKAQGDYQLLSRIIQYSIERKWVEEERNLILAREQNSKKQAEKAVLVRDEFISIASHELKTPITSMKLQLQSMFKILGGKNKIDPQNYPIEKVEKFLNNSHEQIERIIRLIESLLDVTRISSGRLQLELEDLELAGFLKNFIERFQDQIDQRGISLSSKLMTMVTISCDRNRLEQVFINFLTNAIKYGDGKPIHVELQVNDEKVKIIFQDHGIGIAKKNHSRIFSRFERAVGSTNISGLGLGLYISRQIINAHRGTIKLESELGQGSIFTIELPLKLETIY